MPTYNGIECEVGHAGKYTRKRGSIDGGIRTGQEFELSSGHDKEKVMETFDDLLDLVGSQGKFQKRLLYGVICPITMMMPLFFLNTIFMLSEPDHWCSVPGRDNMTSLEAWKNLTIPREIGPNGLVRFSQCRMFDPSDENRTRILGCTAGWDYDRSDYKATIPTDYNWVCAKGHYGAQAFTATTVGGAVGTIVFGWAGDKFGRKFVFFMTCFMSFTFRFISLYVPSYFYVFLGMQFLAGSAFPMMYIPLFTLASELSHNDYRAWIFGANWIIWVLGLSILPLLSWLVGNWYLIGILTSVPGFVIFLYYKAIPESPRWLLTKGRLADAEKILLRIAETNGKKLSKDEVGECLLCLKNRRDGSNQGSKSVWSLFTRKRVAIHTILLSIVWSMNGLVYYGIALNATSMAGNQFLNFFLLSIVELPTGWIGGYLAGKLGRRWTQVLFFVLCLISFGLAALGTQVVELTILIIVSLVVAKFGVAVTSLMVNLQATEIFPTELRSNGSGLACTIAAAFTVLGPYIVYLGKINVIIPYVTLGLVSTIGVICSSFLPETLNQTLPESVDDSNCIGAGVGYWSFLPKDYRIRRRSIEGVENLGVTED